MKTKTLVSLITLLGALFSPLTPQLSAAPLGTAFTYQGQLTDGTNPANGRFDFAFTLYDELLGGRVIAGPLTNSRLDVVDGLFTATLDFRADVFGSKACWLGIAVRPQGGRDFMPLSPRQHLTPTPQALYAANAGDATLLNGQSAASYVAKAGDTMTGSLVVPANGFRAGTDQLVLTGSNVGIGTTSPGALLGLEGDAGADQILVHARGTHTAGAWFSLENTSTDGKRWDFISTGSGNGGGAGNLLFRHAAVGSVLTLTPAGRAGVGTLSPIAKLDVVDAGGTEPTLIRAESSRTAGSTLALVNTDTGGTRWDIISTGTGNSSGPGRLLFREAGGDTLLTLTPGGYMGVGTVVPNSRLEVVGAPNASLMLIHAIGDHPFGSMFALQNTKTGGKRWDFVSTGPGHPSGAGNLMFQADAVSIMTLAPAGYVGIGTVTPTNRLQVVGDLGSAPESVFRVDRHGDGPVAEFVHHTLFASNNFLTCRRPLGGVGNAVVFKVGGNGDVFGQDFSGTSFNTRSDRNAKENLTAIEPSEVLEKVAALPISKWNFKGNDATPHLGPMAQDFHAAFGVGPDDKHIATVDADGVALAAIQGLNQKVERGKQKAESRMERLQAENTTLKQELAELRALVQTLAEKVNGGEQRQIRNPKSEIQNKSEARNPKGASGQREAFWSAVIHHRSWYATYRRGVLQRRGASLLEPKAATSRSTPRPGG